MNSLTKQITHQQITSQGQGVLQIKQSADLTFTEVRPPDSAQSTSLVFAGTKNLFTQAAENKAKGFIVSEAVWNEIQTLVQPGMAIWTTPTISGAMSLILQLFDLKKDFIKPGIHPTAVVDPTAKVDPTAVIGPFCVIEAHAEVGAQSYLASHVYVGAFCIVGARCHLANHVTLGSDGFGFFSDKKNTHHKVPQIGRVVIEDDCELGAFNAVDRATLTETRIKKGTKTDNHCHFAHNVVVGENGLIAAKFGVAGSTKIGRNFMSSGNVDLNGHIEITDGVILTAKAGITSSISKPGVYGGFPHEPQSESVKTLASLRHLFKLRKQVNRIIKHLNLKEE